MSAPEIVTLPPRRVAVRSHVGGLETIDETRRPLYQYLIMHELVGGPSMLRFGDGGIDVMVQAAPGLAPDGTARIEELPGGRYAILHYTGPTEGLEEARLTLATWAVKNGHEAAGPLLQMHLMDEIEGVTEQELQLPLLDGKL